MPSPVFIGDEASATGWRLAGARVVTPTPGEEATTVLAYLSGGTELLLLSTSCARRLPQTLLERVLVSLRPLTLVVPEVTDPAPAFDLMHRVRARMGISA
ncbi:MAG: Vacuolar H+transporting two-sector ATPase F subunit [Magnetococcales bacterium]|nr:Vacuolar H+transporting two-sector ATPase F subunit [Magnetococcales bacterium]